MSLQWLGRNRDAREDTLHHVVRGDVLGKRFEREDDAVAKDVEREVLNVLSCDVAAAAEIGECPTGEEEVDRRRRARAEGDVLSHVANHELGWIASAVPTPSELHHEHPVVSEAI